MQQLPINITTTTIAAAGTTSGAVSLGGTVPCGIITPAALDGSAISFLVSLDDVTYYPMSIDGATTESQDIGVGLAIGLDPRQFQAWLFLKIVSNATETADRAFIISSTSRPV